MHLIPEVVQYAISRRSDYDEMSRIKVGTGDVSKTFEVYKGVLKFYSGYFKASIAKIESGRFAESKDGVITLPEEDPSAFEALKGWSFTHELCGPPGAAQISAEFFASSGALAIGVKFLSFKMRPLRPCTEVS